MKISIGADHRGVELKKKLIEHFTEIEWIDQGADNGDRPDYPIYARRVCSDVLDGKADYGILICGSGIGMSIAANRFNGIYAGLCWSVDVARLAKEDDGVNVLVLPVDFITSRQACEIVFSWLDATFKGGRYQERLEMLD